MKELSKTYQPGEFELKLIEFWEKNQFYKPENNSNKPSFTIVIPPPNVTGNLTVGHILNNTIQDVYSRWKRMSGFNVLWLPGTDHAGIATQTVVEKKLREEKLSRYDLGREKFIAKVWEWKEIYHANIKLQLQRMGASVDWSRECFTMDDGLSKAVRKVFVELYKKGFIYKGKRIINWDPVAQTALSDEEVNYIKRKDKLYKIKYPLLDERDKFVIIATTRPETMLGDTAVAVNPNDERYTNIIGKKILLPIAERVISIIADEYVDKEFGTGALKVTPAHDANDFILGEKYNLETIQVIDHQGKMNDHAGRFSGLDRFEARKLIVEHLKEKELLESIEDYIHNIGMSERGGVIVEPYLSDQWFVSMKSLSEPALNAVLSGEIKFHPEHWTKVYKHWMTNIRDWCISRQLWWGHQIPVWYNKSNGETYCEVEPPKDIENWEQDPDVLDTWFSSWLWPFSTMGWPDDTEDLKKFFPTNLLSTGPDIIFFWVARMIMASIEFTGKIPFTDVYFHNIIRDDKGRKLSKSLGNSPDVIEVMNKYGTDALRFTLVYLAPQGADVFFNEEKCELGRNFANKIWNAGRFLLMKKEQSVNSNADSEKDIFDKWIVSRFNSTLRDYLKALNEYKINEASKALYDFIWRDFCDWYIEVLKIKSNTKSDSSAKIFEVAIDLFESALKLLHPVMPFITEELWQGIKDRKDDESISISDMQVLNESMINSEIEKEINSVQELITSIRNLRAEINLSPAVKCDAIINCSTDADKDLFSTVSFYIQSLSKIENLSIVTQSEFEKHERFKSMTSVIHGNQVHIKIEGLIDVEQEKSRLNKEIERVESFIKSLEKKLSNENFVQKASAEVVENEKKKFEDNKSKLTKLKENYKSFAS